MTTQMLVDGALLLFGLSILSYCIWLSFRLRKPYIHQEKLEKMLIEGQDILTQTKTLLESLHKTVEQGDALKGDLSYFTDRGEELMRHLEPSVRTLRKEVPTKITPSTPHNHDMDAPTQASVLRMKKVGR